MAMDANALGLAIKTDLLTAGYAIDDPALEEIWRTIAQSIVTHLTTQAVITIPLGVAVQVSPATGTGATTAPGIGTIA